MSTFLDYSATLAWLCLIVALFFDVDTKRPTFYLLLISLTTALLASALIT